MLYKALPGRRNVHVFLQRCRLEGDPSQDPGPGFRETRALGHVMGVLMDRLFWKALWHLCQN